MSRIPRKHKNSLPVHCNVEDLDQWLQIAMACHDNSTTMAWDYLDGISDKATEDAESVPSHKSIGSHPHKSSQTSSRAASMTSCQPRRALEATKLRAQEAERQTAAAMQLEKDRFDLRLKEVAEEKRRKLNELKIDEMELADDSSVANDVNLAPLGVNDEDGGTGILTADWVHSIVNQTEREMGVPLPTDVVSPASRGLDQATSSILDNVKYTTHIEENLNQFADNAATDQSNVIDNTTVLSLQQHLNFNSETVAELRPNVFASTAIFTSLSQQRPNFNGQSSLLTNSYVPKMSLWVKNHVAATTSSSLNYAACSDLYCLYKHERRANNFSNSAACTWFCSLWEFALSHTNARLTEYWANIRANRSPYSFRCLNN